MTEEEQLRNSRYRIWDKAQKEATEWLQENDRRMEEEEAT